MINIRTIRKLTNNDGLTLKKGKIITYKSGWQVATEGIETTDAREAIPGFRETSQADKQRNSRCLKCGGWGVCVCVCVCVCCHMAMTYTVYSCG